VAWRGGDPGGPRPSPVILATPTTRGGGSKGRSYNYLISFDPYRTPVSRVFMERRVGCLVGSAPTTFVCTQALVTVQALGGARALP
jgi:hypothetical protein